MPNGFLFLLLISLNVLSAHAQQSDTLWFDAKWKSSSRGTAAYFRPPAVKIDEGYRVADYFTSGKLQMTGVTETLSTSSWKGYVTWYTESGQITQRAWYNKEHQADTLLNYHKNGTLSAIRTFKDGKFHGQMRTYDSLGNLTSERNFENDKLHGKTVDYDRGVVIASGNFYQGEYDGEQLSYFQQSEEETKNHTPPKLETREIYEKGRSISEETFYPNGQLSEKVSYDAEGERSFVIGYSPNGAIRHKANYRNDGLHGTCEFTDDAGKYLIKAQCEDGYLHGIYERVVQGKVIARGDFKNGVLKKWQNFYTNGSLHRLCVVNTDSLTEVWTTFSERGERIMETTYRFQKPYGIWKLYQGNEMTLEVNFGFEPVRNAVSYRQSELSEDNEDEDAPKRRMTTDELLRSSEPMDKIWLLDKVIPEYYFSPTDKLQDKLNALESFSDQTVHFHYGKSAIVFSRMVTWDSTTFSVAFQNDQPGAESFQPDLHVKSSPDGLALILAHESYQPQANEVMMFAEPRSELLQRVIRFSISPAIRSKMRERPSLVIAVAQKYLNEHSHGFTIAEISFALCQEVFDREYHGL